ncbi:M23 family metallopeptidase [Alteromonas oceanisediminis]|uniref:M23 family metallopeptidase n=1 Tax=Alteromonas oceanisediminis TaxID=2836180 RepID=UPI0028F40E69|nr:M23 family metallopeptidase [Alteromonas oceanisediminis]
MLSQKDKHTGEPFLVRFARRCLSVVLMVSMLCISATSIATDDVPYVLMDNIQPGALVRGKVEPGYSVIYQGETLPLTENGHFVFGLGRDASGEVELAWQSAQSSGSKRYALPQREYDIQRINGLKQNYVSPSQATIDRLREDNRKVASARAVRSEHAFFSQSFIWPAQGPVSGVYGSQRILNDVPKRPHFGVDVAGPVGTPIIAPADGIVVLYVPDMVYSGGTLLLDHGHGVTSTFLHLSDASVRVGQRVTQGERIASMGATGRATGSHLDWRINWRNQRVDPQLLVPPRS